MIPLTDEEKDDTIEKYLADLELARELRDHLEKNGPEDKYKDAKKKVESINEAVEKLLIQKLKQWSTEIESFLPEVTALSQTAQKAIDKVIKSINTAKNITKAFSALDKLIQLAGTIKF